MFYDLKLLSTLVIRAFNKNEIIITLKAINLKYAITGLKMLVKTVENPGCKAVPKR